jgi:murein DD-endopeptidase MepM/ murein hydrolase activator NlpD
VKKFVVGTLILLISWASVLNQQYPPAGKDIVLELNEEILFPGDILKVTVRETEPVKLAWLRFQGNKYAAARRKERTELLALIGIDLNQEPGTFALKLSLIFGDGRRAERERAITIKPKEFPVEKLWVEEKFVTPPPEVRERIARESDLLKTVYEIFTPQWLGSGKFIVPTEGEVNSNFGKRRIFNNKPRSPHSGVDISSPLGTPVHASNSGRVVLAADLYFAGQTVIIDHGLGVFSLYLHFSRIMTERGNFVEKGDVIGEVGATGRVTGPHLHWGARILDCRVDPLALVRLELN